MAVRSQSSNEELFDPPTKPPKPVLSLPVTVSWVSPVQFVNVQLCVNPRIFPFVVLFVVRKAFVVSDPLADLVVIEDGAVVSYAVREDLAIVPLDLEHVRRVRNSFHLVSIPNALDLLQNLLVDDHTVPVGEGWVQFEMFFYTQDFSVRCARGNDVKLKRSNLHNDR